MRGKVGWTGCMWLVLACGCQSPKPAQGSHRVAMTTEQAAERVAAYVDGYLQAHPSFARYQGLHAFDGKVCACVSVCVMALFSLCVAALQPLYEVLLCVWMG